MLHNAIKTLLKLKKREKAHKNAQKMSERHITGKGVKTDLFLALRNYKRPYIVEIDALRTQARLTMNIMGKVSQQASSRD